MPDRLTIANINLKNYSHNITKIRELVPNSTKVMAVVKANAYGHGIEKIAETALDAGASYLGVVSLGELKRIRKSGIKAPVILLNYLDADSVEEVIELDGTITVMDGPTIDAINEVAGSKSKQVKVHIKIDTGMHRAGCDIDELVSIAKKVEAAPYLELEGIFTHFAESEALDYGFTHKQLAQFQTCIDLLKAEGINPPLIHCANSAAILAFPETHFTMVRPGLVSYGLNPFPQGHGKHEFVNDNFKPVLSLKTHVVYLRTIDEGETVGYNRRWKAKRQSRLALLPVGYGDGYRRTPHNAAKVLLHGQYAPIVGSISMDQTVIDITDIPTTVAIGDEVMLLGEQDSACISTDDIALEYGTISYEVVTSLSDRIERNFLAI